MSHLNPDDTMVTRYVDGMLHGEERTEFERRLLADARLREAVEQQQHVRDWFLQERDTAPAGTSDGFVGGILAKTRRLPSRSELANDSADNHTSVHQLARQLLVAAAVVFGIAMVTWGGLFKAPDPRYLEAADVDRIERLDRAIEAEALRRDSEQGR